MSLKVFSLHCGNAIHSYMKILRFQSSACFMPTGNQCQQNLVQSQIVHRRALWLQQAALMPSQDPEKVHLVRSDRKPEIQLSFAEKVKESGKDASYTGIIIAGIVVTGFMFYTIGKELFSGQSPSGVYTNAFKVCKKNDEVIAMFGEPLKARGERTSRGRSRFVKHQEFEHDGVKHMRLMFYLQGPHHKGTVHVEAKHDERGKYQFVYIYVEPERYPRFAVVDNR